MSDDLLFQLDTSGASNNDKVKPLRYSSSGYLDDIPVEENETDSPSKPSQERPAILKQKTKRYHELKDDSKFIPGVLSNDLLKALGLRRYDIPDHIYRMRQLGYPPGWLKRCEVYKDKLRIIGEDSCELNESSDKLEDNGIKYDCEKLYEYPGFNSMRDYDERYDYCLQRGFSTMKRDFLLSNFIQRLSQMQMTAKVATNIEEMRLANVDVNNDFQLTTKRKPMATSTPLSKRRKTSGDNNSTGHLSEGEITDTYDEEEEEEVVVVATTESIDLLDESSSKATNDSSSVEIIDDSGTEVVIKKIEKPNLSKFSLGINEHRLFENIPGLKSGTYRQMKKLLDKRHFQLEDEEDEGQTSVH